MKIFISWSGSKSQEIAKLLKRWIPCVIQSAEPYFSSADIDKGARWSTDISKELQDASFGILCVTKENLLSSWLNFEAGALSKSMEQSKVCPFLVDLKPSDIQNSPILQFQMTSTTKDDVYKLFKSINNNIGEPQLSEEVLTTTFDLCWPKIDADIKAIESSISNPNEEKPEDSGSEPIEEILDLLRYQHKLLRTPSELLPPNYLINLFRSTEKIIPKESLGEFILGLRRIQKTANKTIKACTLSRKDDLNPPVCIQQLTEIEEIAERLQIIITGSHISRLF